MKEIIHGSTFAAYKRLFVYARRYWIRLAIGIVAGILCGGSMMGGLQVFPKILQSFDNNPGAATAPVKSGSEALPGGLRLADKVAHAAGFELVTADGRMTWQLLAVGCILATLWSGGLYLNRYYMRWIGARVVRDLRDDLFDGLQNQSLKFFGKNDVGQLISHCTNDAGAVETVIANTAADATLAPFMILFAVIFVITFSIENHMLGFVLGVLIVFPLIIVPIVVLGRRVRRYSRQALERVSDLVSRMHENLTGIRVVKAFNMEKEESRRFQDMNQRYFRQGIRALRAELLMTPLMQAVGVASACVFLSICSAQGLRLPQIIPVVVAAVVVYRPVKQLAQINANLQRGAAALERIFGLLDIDTALAKAEHPVVVEAFRDRIVFDAVSFRYDEDGPRVIDNVSFQIPKGSVLALVGETGSGKTTLANLLARFYDPSAGQVRMDGVDLKQIDVPSLRRLIGIVTQETILFNDTIASNIAYGTPGATRSRIEEAARMANAHQFIMADPLGYDRVVGEKGFVLSGGERQRVAIARTILKNPPILILDEATSALDTVTERLVQEAIARVMENRTVFAIAHRLSTVKHANQILLIDGGRVAERGTHEELYRAGGRYRALCDMQIMG